MTGDRLLPHFLSNPRWVSLKIWTTLRQFGYTSKFKQAKTWDWPYQLYWISLIQKTKKNFIGSLYEWVFQFGPTFGFLVIMCINGLHSLDHWTRSNTFSHALIWKQERSNLCLKNKLCLLYMRKTLSKYLIWYIFVGFYPNSYGFLCIPFELVFWIKNLSDKKKIREQWQFDYYI